MIPIASNLQASKHKPQRMQVSWSIVCTFFRSPRAAFVGQTFAHSMHPVQASVITPNRISALHFFAVQRLFLM